MDDKAVSIVIDHGSTFTKAGFAGENGPKSVFSTVVGTPRSVDGKGDNAESCMFIGDDAKSRRGTLRLTYPIGHGIITNWEAMEEVWRHTFNHQLNVNPEDHPILLTEGVINPQYNREKITQVMFETFQCPAMYLAPEAELSMVASGSTTGIVLNWGELMSHAIPVYEGYCLLHKVSRIPLSGWDLTRHMIKMITEKGYSFTDNYETEIIAQDIKEKFCYVPLDFESEMQTAASSSFLEKMYALPDKKVITIDNERFRCPEALFQPELVGAEFCNTAEFIQHCIERLDVDIRKDMYANIVLSGGTALLPGIADRMQREITSLIPSEMAVNVTASPKGKHSSWVGGSILAASPAFQERWITKQDYNEYGPSIVRWKCF